MNLLYIPSSIQSRQSTFSFFRSVLFPLRVAVGDCVLRGCLFRWYKVRGHFGFEYIYVRSELLTVQCCNYKEIGIPFKQVLFVRQPVLRLFIRAFDAVFYGLNCGYFLRLGIIGYNYRLRTSHSQSYMFFFLGHFFSILIRLPSTVRVFRRKRNFIIFGINLLDFNYTVDYVRHLRDLYPYKTRGFSLLREVVPLKRGKKVKFK